MRDPRHDPLFEPIRVGPKTIRNRFYQTPQCLGAGSEKPGFQAAHRGVKAEGGWGAICTEYCSIHPESDDNHRVSARLWDEGDVRNLARMCDALHEWDALAGVELWYGGPHAPCMESRAVPRAPSQIASDIDPLTVPMEMDKDEISQLQGYYVSAARRARSAGFDIIYVYGAHSYGPMQFLSPFYNRRTDEYGGSFENRARYWREVLELVREAVGEDCAIATRLSVDALGPAGITGDEAVALVAQLDELVDVWDVNVSGVANWGDDLGTSRFFREGYQREWTGKIKEHTAKPVVGVGRFTNPDTMVEVIRSGTYDIIGATRQSIADPFFPRKVDEGQLDDIRECIGINICVSRWEVGGPPVICAQNATAGEEYRRGWHPERFDRARNADKSVLVVGAGPAGMECAIVLARRGMGAVHLIEAEAEIGGHFRWVPQLPGLGEWARIVNHRKIQLDKRRNVEVHTGSRLDADAVLGYGADIAVIASGAHWATDGINGVTHAPLDGADASLDHILTPEQIMLEGKQVGDRVLVYDCEGFFVAVGLAERLAREGRKVTFVTPLAHPGAYMHLTGESPRLHRLLHDLQIELVTERFLVGIENGGAAAASVWIEEDRIELEADSFVLVTQRISNDGLFRAVRSDQEALRASGLDGVYRVGDCVAPRLIADAIFDGHRMGREIDSDDPQTPRPFIRERRLSGTTTDEDYAAQLLA